MRTLWKQVPVPASPVSGNLAVLLIHMQSFFVNQLYRSDARRIIRAQLKLIRECAEHDIPLIVVEMLGRNNMFGGTLEVLQRAALKVPPTKKVQGEGSSGFFETELDEILWRLSPTTLVLAGVEASACVRMTAETAVKLRYEIATAVNLVADIPGSYIKALPDASIRSKCWYEENGTFYETPITLMRN